MDKSFIKFVGKDAKGFRIRSAEWEAVLADEVRRLKKLRERLRDRTTRDRDWKPEPPSSFELLASPLSDPVKPFTVDDFLPPPRPGLLPGEFYTIDPARMAAAAPQPLPARWTADHVGARLIEAHAVLRRLPDRIYPAKFGAAWPAYQHEGGELAVQAGAGTLEIGRNRIAIGASAGEIANMNEAFGWLMTILRGEDRWSLARLNGWAEDANTYDAEKVPLICRPMLAKIAAALNKANVVVR